MKRLIGVFLSLGLVLMSGVASAALSGEPLPVTPKVVLPSGPAENAAFFRSAVSPTGDQYVMGYYNSSDGSIRAIRYLRDGTRVDSTPIVVVPSSALPGDDFSIAGAYYANEQVYYFVWTQSNGAVAETPFRRMLYADVMGSPPGFRMSLPVATTDAAWSRGMNETSPRVACSVAKVVDSETPAGTSRCVLAVVTEWPISGRAPYYELTIYKIKSAPGGRALGYRGHLGYNRPDQLSFALSAWSNVAVSWVEQSSTADIITTSVFSITSTSSSLSGTSTKGCTRNSLYMTNRHDIAANSVGFFRVSVCPAPGSTPAWIGGEFISLAGIAEPTFKVSASTGTMRDEAVVLGSDSTSDDFYVGYKSVDSTNILNSALYLSSLRSRVGSPVTMTGRYLVWSGPTTSAALTFASLSIRKCKAFFPYSYSPSFFMFRAAGLWAVNSSYMSVPGCTLP